MLVTATFNDRHSEDVRDLDQLEDNANRLVTGMNQISLDHSADITETLTAIRTRITANLHFANTLMRKTLAADPAEGKTAHDVLDQTPNTPELADHA